MPPFQKKEKKEELKNDLAHVPGKDAPSIGTDFIPAPDAPWRPGQEELWRKWMDLDDRVKRLESTSHAPAPGTPPQGRWMAAVVNATALPEPFNAMQPTERHHALQAHINNPANFPEGAVPSLPGCMISERVV